MNTTGRHLGVVCAALLMLAAVWQAYAATPGDGHQLLAIILALAAIVAGCRMAYVDGVERRRTRFRSDMERLMPVPPGGEGA